MISCPRMVSTKKKKQKFPLLPNDFGPPTTTTICPLHLLLPLQPEQSAAQASSRPHLVQNPPTAPVSLRVGAKASPAGWLSCSLSDLISDSVPGLYSSFISSDTRSPECCSLCQKHPSCGVSRAPSVPSGFCSNVPPAKRPS